MSTIKITAIVQADVSFKFKDDAIRQQILATPTIKRVIGGEMSIIFVCRQHTKDYQDESLIYKGEPQHTIMIPYDQATQMSADQVTLLCSNLAAERVLSWARRKAGKA